MNLDDVLGNSYLGAKYGLEPRGEYEPLSVFLRRYIKAQERYQKARHNLCYGRSPYRRRRKGRA